MSGYTCQREREGPAAAASQLSWGQRGEGWAAAVGGGDGWVGGGDGWVGSGGSLLWPPTHAFQAPVSGSRAAVPEGSSVVL